MLAHVSSEPGNGSSLHHKATVLLTTLREYQVAMPSCLLKSPLAVLPGFEVCCFFCVNSLLSDTNWLPQRRVTSLGL